MKIFEQIFNFVRVAHLHEKLEAFVGLRDGRRQAFLEALLGEL